jgi:hypothetical protein
MRNSIVGPRGVTKICRQFRVANGAPVYERKIREKETECEGCGLSLAEYSCAHGAQLNYFDYLTPYH